jgi:hypothetical protein
MRKLILTVGLFLATATPVHALDFIPGLKGFGTDTRGPFTPVSDPDICIVTTTGITGGDPGDSTRNGVSVKVGTLNQCIHYDSSGAGKIILFETSGTIAETGTGAQYTLDPYTFIAGQSAPSPGITLKMISLVIEEGGDETIIQHIRVRLGSAWTVSPTEISAFRMKSYGTLNNVILDHVSGSWSSDSIVEIYADDNDLASNITVSNSILVEPTDPGGDSRVLSISSTTNQTSETGTRNITLLNNIFAHGEYRIPQAQGDNVFVNNYTYNSKIFAPDIVGSKQPEMDIVFVGNVNKAGLDSTANSSEYMAETHPVGGTWTGTLSDHDVYFYGNQAEGSPPQADSEDWGEFRNRLSTSDVVLFAAIKVTGETPSTDAPIWPTDLEFIASTGVEAYVSSNAGARPVDRDSVDECIITNIAEGTGNVIVDEDDNCGPWPTLDVNPSTWTLPATPFGDGGDGYTNIEVWLHGLAAEVEGLDFIPGLVGFGTDTRGPYAAINPPEICIVDDLTQNTLNPEWVASGYSVGVFKGSLLQCVEGLDTEGGETIGGHEVLPNSGKIVLFETSGTITHSDSNGATSFNYRMQGESWYAGQSAPAPGILFRNILLSADNDSDIVIQHLRGRMDGAPSLSYGNHKSFVFATSGTGSMSNIIVDHVSAAWGADVQLSFFHDGSGTMQDVTIAHSILGEARTSMGLIDQEAGAKVHMFGQSNSNLMTNYLAYENLFFGGTYRSPKLQNSSGVWVNNVSFNNEDHAFMCYGLTQGVDCVGVGNAVIGGNMSGSFAGNNFPHLGTAGTTWYTPLSSHNVYFYDNRTDAGVQTSANDWSLVDDRTIQDIETNCKVTGDDPPNDAPLWPAGISYISSAGVKSRIINNAGAYPAYRDSLDIAFLDDLDNETGVSSIPTGNPTAWPSLDVHTTTLAIPADPHEVQGSGYTNLEEWLHDLAAQAEGTSPTPSTSTSPIMQFLF